MKLEVGRIYVLVDESITHFEGASEYRRLVKLVEVSHYSKYVHCVEVEGFCCDSTIDMITTQMVDARSLKPASEKQRAVYNKKKKDILIKQFNEMGYWL